MKKVLSSLLILALLFSSTACTNNKKPAETEAPATPTDVPAEIVKFERPADYTKQGLEKFGILKQKVLQWFTTQQQKHCLTYLQKILANQQN